MLQPQRIATAIGGLFGRTAVGLVAILIVVAVVAPSLQTDLRAPPGWDDPDRPVTMVALTVPEGETARSLTVTDGSGRELATVTRSCWWRATAVAPLSVCGSTARAAPRWS
jgi:hypothetical protein